jgi:hypothetical protein
MSAGNKNKIYTAADIERYHKGLMDPAERHAIEKAALDDPFLADALEGYAVADNVSADISDLDRRLSERIGETPVIPLSGKKENFRWMRVAAMIILLAGGAILASQFLFNKKDNEIAKNDQPEAAKENEVTSQTTPADTSGTEIINADSATNYPMVVEEEPGSGGQPNVANTKPVNTGRADQVAKTPAGEDISAPVTIGNNKDEDKTVPAKEAPNRLADATVKDAEGYVKHNAAEEKKMSVTQSRAAGKNKYQNDANIFRGKVTDENDRGLPFANVTNTRDNVGTYTDVSGNFVLTSPDTVLDVQIRSLGYDNNIQQLRTSVPTNKVVMQDNMEGITETIVSRNNSNALRRQDNNMKVEEPEPADGWENYDVYLANNLNMPAEFRPRPSAPQEVELSFEVNKLGEPVNIRVERSLCKSCDEEAIRLVKEGPKWKRNARKRTRLTVAF